MKNKLIILIILLLFSSGCTIDYNLIIDEELLVDEIVTLKESTYVIKTQTLDVDNFLDSTINDYKEDSLYDKYIYEKQTDDLYTSVDAKAIYLDFQDYLEKNIVREIAFDDIKITKEDKIYEFIFAVKESSEIDLFNESELYSSTVDEIRVNITLPFKVLANNSNNFDIDKNTYTWIYKKNQQFNDIMIKFDISKQPIKRENTAIYFIAVVIISIMLFSIIGIYRYKKFNKL